MDNFEDNAVKIANYLDERMSPVEEEAFMQELGDDEGLRQQFEDELLVHALLKGDEEEGARGGEVYGSGGGYGSGSGSGGLGLVSGGETGGGGRFSGRGESGGNEGRGGDMGGRGGGQEGGGGSQKKSPVISMLMRYRVAAAVILLLCGGAAVFLLNNHGGEGGPSAQPPTIAATPGAQDSSNMPVGAPPRESGGSHPVELLALTENRMADSVFRVSYMPYSEDSLAPRGDRLGVLSKYYMAYRQGNYSFVLSAKESDYLGSGNRKTGEDDLIREYLHFYKGISWLASGKTAEDMQKAIQEFEPVLAYAGRTGSPYYDAQWYSALTSLRVGDLEKAGTLAKDILESASPYRPQAMKMLQGLAE